MKIKKKLLGSEAAKMRMTSREKRAAILQVLSDKQLHSQLDIAKRLGLSGVYGGELSARIRDLRKKHMVAISLSVNSIRNYQRYITHGFILINF